MEQSTNQADPPLEEVQPAAATVAADAVPSWLKMLEEQSYQAELLISGLVVAGLLRFPDLAVGWLEGIILDSSELGFTYLSIAGLMVVGAGNALLFFFFLHFLLRSIWVALLGLNSVYPKGVNEHSTLGSGPVYWRKAKAKYPNLSAYNLALDRQCSVIFSMASATFIVFLGISALILVVYWVFAALISYFPVVEDYALVIGVVLYVLFVLVAIVLQQLGKKYPDNARVERITERYSNFSTGLFSLYFFQKPVGYISSVLISNTKPRNYFLFVIVGSMCLGLFGGMQTNSHQVFSYMKPDRYASFNNRPDYTFAFNYDNLRDPEQAIFTPFIQSDRVEEQFLKVFIPIIEREKAQLGLRELSLIEKFQYSRPERDSIQQYNLSKYAAFHKVYLNDSLIENLQYHYYVPHNGQTRGLQVYIPILGLPEGRNLLQIRKQYFVDGQQKIVTIPFYYQTQ